MDGRIGGRIIGAAAFAADAIDLLSTKNCSKL